MDIAYVEVVKIIRKIFITNSYDTVVNLVESRKEVLILSFVNAHAINMALIDTDFRHSLLRADLILVDGIGMKILFDRLGLHYGLNMNGTDFIPYLLENINLQKISIYGSNLEIIKNVKEKISIRHNVIDCYHGFENSEFYTNRIQLNEPNTVLLGMGMPKQEKLSCIIKDNANSSILIINGGAIVDFIGGKVNRAPYIIRKLNMEWFYRLCNEPVRLFRRYVIGNFLFFIRIKRIKSTFNKL